MIQQGWREQYDRMLRSREWLRAVGTTSTSVGSDEARDRLFHFFQDAFHVRDWIKNDSVTAHLDPFAAVRGAIPLQLCADLANGTKHRELDPHRKAASGDPSTAFTTQSVTVSVPPVTVIATLGPAGGPLAPGSSLTVDAQSVRGPSGFATHTWQVESGGQTWDAQELADDVVLAWNSWLTSEGLLP